MKIKNGIIWLSAAFLLFISMACLISFTGDEPTEDEISAALTVQAIQQTQTSAAATVTAEASPEVDPTVEVTSEATDDNDEGEDDDDTCNVSKFVSETIPDGTVYQKGDTFTKTWTIRNAGTCAWTTGYRFVFEDGDAMDGLASMNLEHTVQPGSTYTFELDLTAPSTNGNYTGVWRIKSNDGVSLGKYWVNIWVGAPPAAFAVTSVTFYMPHTTIDMACAGDVVVSASVTTSAAGVVGMKWEDSVTSGLPTKSFTFAGAETKVVQHTMTIPNPGGDHWAKLYIDTPNHQWFGPINFHVNCTP